jgi:hypothetical protein
MNSLMLRTPHQPAAAHVSAGQAMDCRKKECAVDAKIVRDGHANEKPRGTATTAKAGPPALPEPFLPVE